MVDTKKKDIIRAEGLSKIVKSCNPKTTIIFKNISKKKALNGEYVIKDAIIQKQKNLDGEITHQLILLSEFINPSK